MQKIILDKLENIKVLCVEYNVQTLFAFGSVCTENFNSKSDIDLLISFKPMDYSDYADSYFNIVDKFEEVFNRPVDLITEKSLNNPYFIESINKNKTKLYESRD